LLKSSSPYFVIMPLFDLHCHTSRYSYDSRLDPEDLLEGLVEAGIDGAVITEHNNLWPADELDALLADSPYRNQLKIWAAQEVRTHHQGCLLGDLLVYDVAQEFPDGTEIDEVMAKVKEAEGFTIAAHIAATPWGMGTRSGDFGLDAIEILNSRYGKKHSAAAEAMLDDLYAPCTGGSDAHDRRGVGLAATKFPGSPADYSTLDDLKAAIRKRLVEPWEPPNQSIWSRFQKSLSS
jgi:predicted metal-dependent phosphoesterase TrpH